MTTSNAMKIIAGVGPGRAAVASAQQYDTPR